MEKFLDKNKNKLFFAFCLLITLSLFFHILSFPKELRSKGIIPAFMDPVAEVERKLNRISGRLSYVEQKLDWLWDHQTSEKINHENCGDRISFGSTLDF
jgi:hypothetical protein